MMHPLSPPKRRSLPGRHDSAPPAGTCIAATAAPVRRKPAKARAGRPLTPDGRADHARQAPHDREQLLHVPRRRLAEAGMASGVEADQHVPAFGQRRRHHRRLARRIVHSRLRARPRQAATCRAVHSAVGKPLRLWAPPLGALRRCAGAGALPLVPKEEDGAVQRERQVRPALEGRDGLGVVNRRGEREVGRVAPHVRRDVGLSHPGHFSQAVLRSF